MLKALLVDDEMHILKFLKKAINWDSLDIEICACATSGIDAINAAMNYEPDIVVTDICMPDMTGLDLCPKLKEINPEIKIVILSGHADFAYAQKAIHHGVTAYSLKPLNIEDFTIILRNLVKEIRHNQYNTTDLLLDVIESGTTEEIETILTKLDLNCKKYYIAVSAHLGNLQKKLNAKVVCKLGNRKFLYFSENPFNYNQLVAITCMSKHGGIGYLEDSVCANELANAIQEASAMAYQYFISGLSTVCSNFTHNITTEKLFSELENVIINKQKLIDYLYSLLDVNLSMIFNIKTAFRFYNKISTCPFFYAYIDEKEHFLYAYEDLPVEFINFSVAIKELLQQLEENCFQVVTSIKEEKNTFMQILRYINENYNKDLSLKKIANKFYMNASYISQLIKNETSLTYSQYITELRIEKAKHLLQTTDMTIAQISEAVGFNDYFYFIKKFKKEVGISPGKF